MTIKQRNIWKNIFRRGGADKAPEAPTENGRPPAEPAPQTFASSIAPNDPILAYFAGASGVVEIERLDFDSPALEEPAARVEDCHHRTQTPSTSAQQRTAIIGHKTPRPPRCSPGHGAHLLMVRTLAW